MQTLLRTIATVLSLATFIGIVFWAFSRRRNSDFDEASRLPFNEDVPVETTSQEKQEPRS